jgi:2',3'-cyclic-nucleotide 2'-phosphodiesterase (5'-nucleotidase family)
LARSRLRLTALLVLLLLLAPAAALAEDKPDLTVFFSSDTRGMLRRCGCSEGQMGGLSARASYIKQNRIPGKTLVLDAGDTLFDGPEAPPDMREFYSLKARTLLMAMKQSGYDAAAAGEYDLVYGKDFLLDASRNSGFTLLSANLSFKNKHPFKAALIRRFDGFKVGVIGVIDDQFPYKSFTKSFGAITVGGPVPSAKSVMGRLAGKVDIVIVLAHLSIMDASEFARSVPGADIVIQGHSQELLESPIEVGDTLVVKGFDNGKRIGRLDLWLKRDDKGRINKAGKKIKEYKYQVVTLDESIPPDPAVEGIISGYRRELESKKFFFERPDPAGAGRYVGPAKCRNCHAAAFHNWSATAHARAFHDLVNTGDQYDPECLSCHVTGYGFVSGYKAGGDLVDVTCESCHGRGSGHVESGEKRGPVAEKTCLGCHDVYQSPNFQFEKYKAMGGAHQGK